MQCGLQTGAVVCCTKTSLSEYVSIQALSFIQKSSSRFKTDIETLTDEEARKILEIHPVTFFYTNQEDRKKRSGVIAEEAIDVIPSVVSLDEEGNPDGVSYPDFVPYLIKMIQIQQREIDQLKEQITKQ